LNYLAEAPIHGLKSSMDVLNEADDSTMELCESCFASSLLVIAISSGADGGDGGLMRSV